MTGTGDEQNAVDLGRLSRFAEAEFFHTIGSYTEAISVLEDIANEGREHEGEALDRTRNLSEIVDLALEHNKSLAESRDMPPVDARHPEPPRDGEELAYNWAPRIDRFYRAGEKALEYLLEPRGEKAKGEPGEGEWAEEENPFLTLGRCLYWEQDPASSALETNSSFAKYLNDIAETRRKRRIACESHHVKRRVGAKLSRFSHRREGIRGVFPLDAIDEGRRATQEYVELLLNAHLGGPGKPHERSAMFVLDCLAAAHFRLHSVEYRLAQPFKQAVEMHKGGRGKAKQLLCEAEVLHTFVFVACRSFPWVFACNQEERDELRTAQSVEPKGAMASRHLRAARVARRLSFLALNRRAFGYGLMDRLEQGTSNHLAFKDFHKLQRLLRMERRLLDAGAPPQSGAAQDDSISERAFIDGMVALAETHIGELYRSDHAHPLALRHFCDAYDRLEVLARDLTREGEAPVEEDADELTHSDVEEQMKPWLRESRWRIRLLISKAKGFYEVGNLKRSIKWMVRSWRALLYLRGDPESTEVAQAKVSCTKLIRALETIRNDPDFSKKELEELVAPVVDSATSIDFPEDVKALASEILLRLGHTLFVIKLGGEASEPDFAPSANRLAYACLERAAEFDPSNVLIEADLLKIQLDEEEAGRTPSNLSAVEWDGIGNERDGANQWPFGRGEAEQTIRMIEYLQLRRLQASRPGGGGGAPGGDVAAKDPAQVEQAIARALIRQFLTHTDSINVKQSQVYRYLMRPRRDSDAGMREVDPPIGVRRAPSIEFVCLRRYSSFFPFVPRPSAFRALGGGYFVRLHDTRDLPGRSYGIAIDPGPDFIGNLYRCGFSLSDIDMVVVTHDHADHAANLDPLLSLLGYRLRFGDKTYKVPKRKDAIEVGNLRGPKAYGKAHRLLIVGNESVMQRFNYFNPPHMTAPGEPRPDAVRVMSFDQFQAFQAAAEHSDVRREADFSVPSDLRLTPVASTRHRDGYGFLAYGMRISIGDGPSIAFTGDTGGFRFRKVHGTWRAEFEEHEEAGLRRVGADDWRDHWRPMLSADVLVAHMSSTPFTQLQAVADGGIETGTEEWEAFKQVREEFLRTWNYISDEVKNPVNFAFWLSDSDKKTREPLKKIPANFKWPKDHLYFGGLLEFARAYKEHQEKRRNPSGLFLIGELREELGTFRSKVALNVNKHIFGESEDPDGRGGCRALTADVGLRLSIEANPAEPKKSIVRVLCSTCDLDNDRPEGERYHHPSDIYEVCVKGENEGIFYNCFSHDPSNHSEKVFLERIERYDIFASELFR